MEPVHIGKSTVPVNIAGLGFGHRRSGTVIDNLTRTLVGTGLEIVDAHSARSAEDTFCSDSECTYFTDTCITDRAFRQDRQKFHRHIEVRQRYRHICFTAAECRLKFRALEEPLVVLRLQS